MPIRLTLLIIIGISDAILAVARRLGYTLEDSEE